MRDSPSKRGSHVLPYGAACALLVVAGCKRSQERSATDIAPPPAQSQRAVVDGEVLHRLSPSDPTAFELVPVRDGVALAYGVPSRAGGGLAVMFLDAQGNGVGKTVVAGEKHSVVELAGAAAAERVAFAWVGRTESGAKAFATVGDTPSRAFEPATIVGAATIASSERGHVAIGAVPGSGAASGQERFIAFFRGGTMPCSEAASGCTELPLYEIGGQSVNRLRVALSVPAPCGRAVPGFASTGGRWYYGVCAIEDGRASTTLFTIEHDPEYAHADRLLPGCVPLALAKVDGTLLFVGRCGMERKAVRLEHGQGSGEPVSVASPEFRCEKDGPVLTTKGPDGVTLRLSAAALGFAALLPDWMAPPDARAVWTGKALLVASAQTGDVVVRRFGCGANSTDGNSSPKESGRSRR